MSKLSSKKCVVEVDDRLFCKEAVLKTSYLFTDSFFIATSYKNEHIILISIEPKDGSIDYEVGKKFANELIAQMVRYNLSKSNKVMKELILGRALYSTCLDEAEPDKFDEESLTIDYSLDDIAVSWFDKFNG